MSQVPLRNFCVEPTSKSCICPRHAGCGGLVELVWACPEHGTNSGPGDLMKSHFHDVKGFFADSAREFIAIYQRAS